MENYGQEKLCSSVFKDGDVRTFELRFTRKLAELINLMEKSRAAKSSMRE